MFLAIDLGSTFFKTALFDTALNPIARGKGALQYVYGTAGEIEIEPGVVTTALTAAIRETLSAPGVTPSQIKAVAITSQAQTFAVAAPDGRIRTSFISWQDARANATAAAMSGEPVFADFSAHGSFGGILGALMVAILRHQQTAIPGWVSADDCLVPLPSEAFRMLTGELALDRNLAAMSGLYSMASGTWHAPYLAACGVTPAQLPRLVETGAVAGTTVAGNAFGLPAGLPVLFAGNDQTAGAYGAEVEKSGAVLITLGTAQVAYCTDASVPQPQAELIRGPYPGGGGYRLVADGVGGGIVTWAAEALGTDYDGFFRLVAEADAECHGVVFEPDLPSGRGGWSKVGMAATRADLARAVIAGLCRRLVKMLGNLGSPVCGRPVCVAGGGSARPEWVGMLGAMLGTTPVPVTADPLLGAARMAKNARAR